MYSDDVRDVDIKIGLQKLIGLFVGYLNSTKSAMEYKKK